MVTALFLTLASPQSLSWTTLRPTGWYASLENWSFWTLTLTLVDLAFVSYLRCLALLFNKPVSLRIAYNLCICPFVSL
jgi:hypothetical protein